MSLTLSPGRKAYFASDFHLGMYPYADSAVREKELVAWLESIRKDAAALFLLGDLFDFWFEYRLVVPKGAVRFLGKLCELADDGVEVHIFGGNHDTWLRDYFQREAGIFVHPDTFETEISGVGFFLSHGDGVGPVRFPYRWMRRVFRCPVIQRMYAALPVCIGVGFGRWWAKRSALKPASRRRPIDLPTEPSYLFACDHAASHPVRYYVFGHLHRIFDEPVSPEARYINVGDWVKHRSFAVFDGTEMTIGTFTPPAM